MDVKIIEADLVARGLRVALLASRFNHFIVDRLVEGATDCVKRHGGEDITLVRAPGAWELPLICQTLARSGRFDAVVALGKAQRDDDHGERPCALQMPPMHRVHGDVSLRAFIPPGTAPSGLTREENRESTPVP